MRLIDADMLTEQVKAIHRAVDASEINLDYDTGFHSATSQIQGLIETMPTAYDVDKVVEQLEEYSFSDPYGDDLIDLRDAIEIVKGGGRDDEEV